MPSLWVCWHSSFKLYLGFSRTKVQTQNLQWLKHKEPGKSWQLLQWVHECNPPKMYVDAQKCNLLFAKTWFCDLRSFSCMSIRSCTHFLYLSCTSSCNIDRQRRKKEHLNQAKGKLNSHPLLMLLWESWLNYASPLDRERSQMFMQFSLTWLNFWPWCPVPVPGCKDFQTWTNTTSSMLLGKMLSQDRIPLMEMESKNCLQPVPLALQTELDTGECSAHISCRPAVTLSPCGC